MRERIIQRLRAVVSGDVIPHASLRERTTYRVGGPAEALVTALGPEDIERACRFALTEGIPLTVLGAGSNVIAPDEGIEGIVVCTAGSARIAMEGRTVEAAAGTMLEALIRGCAERGLGGLEATAGIPGTIGGALVMNAGTDAGTIADRLLDVTVIDARGTVKTLPASDLSFGYRAGPFTAGGEVILSATFSLEPAETSAVLRAVEDAWERRRRSYPLEHPSAGSVFRRPPGDYAGRLIEQAGCKGLRVGGAEVSERHANFIVNRGGATAADIVALIDMVGARVRERSGVDLELEQIVLPRRPRRRGSPS